MSDEVPSTDDTLDRERLASLLNTVMREAEYLKRTDKHLFAQPFTVERVMALPQDDMQAESCDAFVARFGRLQDTLGNKLLPEVLRRLAEPIGPAIDNLDKAEKWGLLASSHDWLTARILRNRMVHEYASDAAELAGAFNSCHATVPLLCSFADALAAFCKARWQIDPPPV